MQVLFKIQRLRKICVSLNEQQHKAKIYDTHSVSLWLCCYRGGGGGGLGPLWHRYLWRISRLLYPLNLQHHIKTCVCESIYRPGLGISVRDSRENPKSGLLQRCHVVAGRPSDLPEVNITLNSTQERDNCSLLLIWKHTDMCTWCAFVFSTHVVCVYLYCMDTYICWYRACLPVDQVCVCVFLYLLKEPVWSPMVPNQVASFQHLN